jgi:hypothetical protein
MFCCEVHNAALSPETEAWLAPAEQFRSALVQIAPSSIEVSWPPHAVFATDAVQSTIEMIFDPPGHVRLPINDDEIIDRALAIEPLADRKVTLLTYDTGQSTRARNAGLQMVKLSKEIGEEPV